MSMAFTQRRFAGAGKRKYAGEGFEAGVSEEVDIFALYKGGDYGGII